MKVRVHKVSKGQELMKDVELGRVGSMGERFVGLKEEIELLKSLDQDRAQLIQELSDYSVSLPEELEYSDLATARRLYARTQAYLSRVYEIQAAANKMESRWKMLMDRFKVFIEDSEDEAYLSDDVINLPNARLQKALVNKKTRKLRGAYEKIQSKHAEATSFARTVDLKQKDLNAVFTNLNRQIKTLGLKGI